MVLPPLELVPRALLPKREGGESSLPALGPMAVWCPRVVLAGRQRGHRQWVQVKLDRRWKVVGQGRGCRGRSPPRVTRARDLGILGCSCVSGTTTNSESLKQKGAVGLWGSQARLRPFLLQVRPRDPWARCRVSHEQISTALGGGVGGRPPDPVSACSSWERPGGPDLPWCHPAHPTPGA